MRALPLPIFSLGAPQEFFGGLCPPRVLATAALAAGAVGLAIAAQYRTRYTFDDRVVVITGRSLGMINVETSAQGAQGAQAAARML